MEWIRHRITAVGLSAAAAIVGLELITPGIFDFVFDLILLALIAVVGKVNERPRP